MRIKVFITGVLLGMAAAAIFYPWELELHVTSTGLNNEEETDDVGTV